MTEEMRMESDSIGTMEVPKEAYYGVQALRAKQNFPITGQSLHPVFIRNLAKVKKAAAQSNRNALALPADKAEAIIRACDEVIRGCFADEFIVDAIQGGAGTSANMNMNEVLANRANEWMGGRKGDYSRIHPNDHVNMSQSTNDVIPTAGKLTVLELLKPLLAELDGLERELRIKAAEFDGILKMGRTQLQDAVPMRLGQTFHAYATMVKRDYERLKEVRCEMFTVNLGGTAIGTAINVSPAYLSNVVPTLAKITGYPLKQAEDLFDATENLDGFVMVSGALKACAVDLSKMCNDLRLLSSGPRTGFGEINLPARQNGSSIMPGKVNPVMVFYSLFDSIDTLKEAVETLTKNCIHGITANEAHCRSLVDKSVGISTALCPYLGYKESADIAKTALRENKSVREIVLERKLMSEADLEHVLNPEMMTEVHFEQRKAM